MGIDPRTPGFDAARTAGGGRLDARDMAMIHAALDAMGVVRAPGTVIYRLSSAGKAIIKKYEGCAKLRKDGRYDAYPDPGSADGRPWTIGWGSTGPDITRGTVWDAEECDVRFDRDVQRYADEVAEAIGDAPTTQAQFDALVSFHYNTGAIGKATLTKLHKAGDHAGARREFAKWVNNDGKVMAGLIKRRREEAELYGS